MKKEAIIKRGDMLACILCRDAPCDAVCYHQQRPSELLRSIWFDNEDGAALRLYEDNPCAVCDAPCEGACVKSGQVPVRDLLTRLAEEVRPAVVREDLSGGVDLTTDICGVPVESPFLLSSSVVASNYDMCARAFETGWAGAAFKTICSMDIREASPRFAAVKGASGCFTGFKNIEQLSDHTVEENMAVFRRLKKEYPHKFILASIMGKDDKEWGELAHICEENGADAIELNFSCPNMMEEGLGSDIGQVPELVERFTAAAKARVKIPVLAKPTPNVAEMSAAAEAARRGGADGISAINTIKSIMGLDLDTYVSSPAVQGHSAVGGYSGRAVKPIALRFMAELGHNEKLRGMHFSGMGGIETWRDALEFMLLGAGSVQVTTAVMEYGYRIVEDMKEGLSLYMRRKGMHRVSELAGLALPHVSPATDTLRRDAVVYPKFDRKRCLGCGRCVISCDDGGHQALKLNEGRRPVLLPKNCVGCHLCLLVCPAGAIRPSGKIVTKS